MVSALPSLSLSNLLQKDFRDISEILKSIPYVTVGVVNLAFPNHVTLPVQGFGYLIPKSENDNESILGTIFDSDAMPFQSNIPMTRLTVMMGGHRFESLFGDTNVSKTEILNVALDSVKRHLNINFDPVDSMVNIHQNCIPQYVVGHAQKMAVLHHHLKTAPKINRRLTVVGSSYTGVSVNDCIFESFKVVKNLLNNGSTKTTGLEKFISDN